MPTVIAKQPGRVVVIPDAEAAPLPFAMSDWGGAAGFKAIVTEVSGSQREAFQVTPAFARAVYADSFGRAPGQLRVAGIAFADACDADPMTGLEYVRDYYDRNCASARPEPVTAILGTTGACREVGFLVGLDVAANQADTRLASFALSLQTIPRRYS